MGGLLQEGKGRKWGIGGRDQGGVGALGSVMVCTYGSTGYVPVITRLKSASRISFTATSGTVEKHPRVSTFFFLRNQCGNPLCTTAKKHVFNELMCPVRTHLSVCVLLGICEPGHTEMSQLLIRRR